MRFTFFLLLLCGLLLTLSGMAQQPDLVLFSGCVFSDDGVSRLPHATIASYSQVKIYTADERGCFRIYLPAKDSVRVTAIGFEPRTYVLSAFTHNSAQQHHLTLKQHSYMIKEVTIKPSDGIFDPLIFKKHLDDSDGIQLNLPKEIGSRMSKVPLSERPEPPASLASPVSLIYRTVSGKKSPTVSFEKARNLNAEWNKREAVAGREVIAQISGLEGTQLDAFIVYCNVHLVITDHDTGVSASQKIEALFEIYKQFVTE